MGVVIGLYRLDRLEASLKHIKDPTDVHRFIWRRRDFARCFGRRMLKRYDAPERVYAILTGLAEEFVRKQIRGEDSTKASARFNRCFSAAQPFVSTESHKAILQSARTKLKPALRTLVK